MSLLDKASLIVTPNAVKESKLYSVVPNTTLGDMDVVRATTATRVNSAGLIEVVPRNLVAYSNDFNDASWGKQNCSITQNYGNNPFGIQNASLIEDSVGTSTQYRVSRGVTAVNGIFNLSLYVKRLSGTKNAYIDIFNQTAYFNFSTETIFSSAGNVSFTKLDDGWYRINISNPTVNSIAAIYLGFANGNSETYTSTGGNQMLFYASQLEQGSTATEYFPTTTRLNIPRIDYTNGSCPSLLVEPQRTNLTTYSEQFDDASWAKTNMVIVANNTISPNGISNADKVVENTSNGFHLVEKGNFLSSGQTYTVSCFLKKAERTFGYIGVYTVESKQIRVNLTTGVIENTAGTWISTSIEYYGNGWYRVVGTFSASAATFFFIGSALNATTITYTGDGTSGIYVWGAQLELGAYPTSYIPTVASSVTRNADVISKTGISSLIGQTEGTMFVDINRNQRSENYNVPIFIGSYSTTNFIQLYFTSSNVLVAQVYTISGQQVAIVSSALSSGRYKIAFGYKQNDFAMYINGSLIGASSSGNVPTCSQIVIGNDDIGTTYFGDSINSAQLYKTRLTNTELAQLTTL